MLKLQAVSRLSGLTIDSLRGLSPVWRLLLFLCCSAVYCQAAATENNDTLTEQRKAYVSAKKSLEAGHYTTFRRKAANLVDYPLYPYLEYHYLSRRLWKVKNEEVIAFLENHADLPTTDRLRSRWLSMLAKRGHWQTFVDNYLPRDDKELQCFHLLARMNTGNESYLLEDIRTTWLSGESLPPQCDPAFALLYKSELMSDELIWQRIRLAMDNSRTGLASFLANKLQDADRREWVNRWLAMHHNPSKHTYKVRFEDTEIAREILLHGMKRLMRQDIRRALTRWEDLPARYNFTTEEISDLEYQLALRAARKKHKDAKRLLSNIPPSQVDEQVLHLRLRTALADYDWEQILAWTEGEPLDEGIKLRWLYWRARALEKTGNPDAARAIYSSLAEERDYYGFLAADRLGRAYKLNYKPVPDDVDERQELSELPAIQRAREFYLLGSFYSARREWHHALNHLTGYQKQIAAGIAADWGWYDRAILTLAYAKKYDDLVTRFPMPFNQTMQQFSSMRDLDIAWLYALARAESAFIEDVRSPAGALGLMQVMPATGRITARRIGLRNYDTGKLKQENVNVRLGSAYLKQMYESFNRSVVLATAAYNAGPNNVKRWLPEKDCEEADIWIEKIPFTETRKYVRRILFFASIYDWRLNREIVPIAARVSQVQPNRQIIASLSCPVEKV